MINKTEIYVNSSCGNDTNDGNLLSPFKTINRAQEEVRKCNKDMKSDIVVKLSGTFEIDSTILFTPEDSGSNGFKVIYEGVKGETVISGGKEITGWEETDVKNLYKAKAGENAIFRQFYIGNNRGVRSKSKWMYYPIDIYKDPDSKYHKHCDYDGYVLSGDDFPEDFSYTEGMEAIWLPSWKNVRLPVEKLYKREDGNYVMVLKQPSFDAVINTAAYMRQTSPFYFENTPEFLDEPGEWYYNKNTDEIFYYKRDNEVLENCFIPKTEGLISVKGENKDAVVSDICFKNIEFKYGAWERTSRLGFVTIQAETIICDRNEEGSTNWVDDGIYGKIRTHAQVDFNYVKNISVTGCKFSHLGSIALAYNNAKGGEISGNIFDDISSAAIVIGDDCLDDPNNLDSYCQNLLISNNLIRRTAVEYMTPQITLYHGNNIKITHNDIKDAPYTGISFGWGWGENVPFQGNCEISYNRIENVLYKTKDGSHIYTLDKSDNTVIKGNFCRKSGEWKGGIYLDNSSENYEIFDNVFDSYKWLKLTYHNIKNNKGYNNFSVRPGVNFYKEQNNIDEEIPLNVNEELWVDEAKEIVNSSGLEEGYKGLYDEYAKMTDALNPELNYLKYFNHPGIIIPAGHYMEGGEGVAYHNILHKDEGMAIDGEPSFIDTYDGTGHMYIMTTFEGEWIKYKFTAEEDGNYDIFIKAAAVEDGVFSTVFIDDEIVAEKVPIKKNCTDYLTFDENYICKTFIKKGEHILKVLQDVKNHDLFDIRLTKEGDTHLVRNDGFVKEIMDVIK